MTLIKILVRLSGRCGVEFLLSGIARPSWEREVDAGAEEEQRQNRRDIQQVDRQGNSSSYSKVEQAM